MFKTLLFLLLTVMPLSACDNPSAAGDKWVEIKPPPDCKVKQIAGEGLKSVAVLCEDGRVFH
jgi:hypothetical protein